MDIIKLTINTYFLLTFIVIIIIIFLIKFQIPNSGFRIPDSGFRIPDSGFRIPGFRVAHIGLLRIVKLAENNTFLSRWYVKTRRHLLMKHKHNTNTP